MTNVPYADVIGDPIAQSKSPLIHGFWLRSLGLAGDYRRAHVTPEELAAYIARRRSDPDWRGCNVTMPHKGAVMELVDDPGNIRGTIGAMNTIVRQKDGSLIGTNTDAAGFYSPLAELDLDGAPVAVVGAGGAARAVLFALARANVGSVTILNRSPLKAMGLLATFGLKGEVVALDAQLPPVALLVNSSSLGMKGQPPLDIDLAPLPDGAIVYDLVYSPLQTGLLKAAEARGLDTVDGLDMLIGQAALAFELFFGASPPEGRDEELRALLTA
ncbi:shikimate dehydrogenase [Sphingopyxis sp. RIFCSPHIGHO2_12_FULL_65_19]|uniref:shikimate dehydrogenase n=1 Tax=Sphingopyxis sp. RIFCSPHIGHO2_12_FULL_65_19 TaxID=1802172 RepID=UPI0008D15414|nr:shikimate dehydrogenase [Sphingopyxis sp. RIFCSPHIGHO2_12_FULL_65_19]OHD07393.1 MAG: shikimate dehydrogenase [Sphingopyxis sp. RIFCSPHIGHO2_12_FULL_65_19]